MLERFLGKGIHDRIQITLLTVLAIALTFSKALMSISIMLLLLNLLLEGSFKTYFERLKRNRIILILLMFFAIQLLSVAWSEFVMEGFKDIKTKLPILLLPVVLVSKPVSRKAIQIIFGGFLMAVLFVSVYNFIAYQGWIGNRIYDDIRGMSLFSSHVRFALLISMATAILLIHDWGYRNEWFIRIPLIIWFVFYTYYSQVLTGALTLGSVLVLSSFFVLHKQKKWLGISFLAGTTICLIMALIWVFRPISYNLDEYQNLPIKTAEGNLYYHAPKEILPETGEPIEIMICWPELEREWPKVSKIPYDSTDLKGQNISSTLVRYMASKGLNKDAEGFSKLTSEDIGNIEKGHASIYYSGILARVYGLQYQLNNDLNPNGHSLLERLEYWRHGMLIIKSPSFFAGVGVGDVQSEFNRVYQEHNTQLEEANWHRAHNMFLTTLIGIGIIGLFIFIWLHSEFILQMIRSKNTLALLFMIITLVSYMTEDTLETQTGVTFFSLFFALFISRVVKASKN